MPEPPLSGANQPDTLPAHERMRMARAVEDSWCAAWASLGALPYEPRSLVDDSATMLRVVTPGMPETLMNMVMRYRTPGPVTRAAVEEVIAPYRQHRLPFQWWHIRDDAPAGLREQLSALGMLSWGGATMMYLDLTRWNPVYPAAPPGVSYRRVAATAASDPDRADALRIISQVFETAPFPMSRWTSENPAFALYLAHWGHFPVATVATLPVGETVGVYHVATLPDARRRGIAGNLLLLALREAQAAGYTGAALTATPEGQHLYTQLSFRVCGLLEQWMVGPRLGDELLRGARPHPQARRGR